MRQTNYKVDRIKVFIINNSPTKSELVKHIAVDINQRVSREYYEKYKRGFRGYYNTNIQTMRYAGNIASDKNGKYYVTQQGLTNENSLYIKPDKQRVRDLQETLNNRNDWIRRKNKNIRDLEYEVFILKSKLKDINTLSS